MSNHILHQCLLLYIPLMEGTLPGILLGGEPYALKGARTVRGGEFIDLNKVLRSGSTVRPYHDYAFFMNRGSRLGSYLTNVTDGDGYKSVRKELRTTLKMRSRLRATIPNPKYVKLEYVRYADD